MHAMVLIFKDVITFSKDHARLIHAVQSFLFKGVCRFAGLVPLLFQMR